MIAMDNNQHSSAFSLSNFKNNILDDDSDDYDDDDSDAYDNDEKDFGESRNVVDHMVRGRDGDVRQLGQARLSPEITDAKQTAMNELGREMFFSIGEKSHRLFEDGIASGVNGKREQTLQENPANSVASNSSTSRRRPYNKNKLSTTKNNEKDDFSPNLSPTQNIKPVTDCIKGDMSTTIDFNPDLTRKFHQDYASGHEIANARSPFTKPVSIAIPAKPARTNKNAPKSDRMNPKTDEATVTHTAMRWDITDGDLKKLSAYTLFSSHLKQNRRTFSWHGYIPADAPNFKLPQLATPYKIRPKFKHKMAMFFPIVHVAKVATSNEMDDDVIVANLTSVGITQYVPCMQCFASGVYSGGSDAGTTGNTFLQNGKCPRCGVSLISSLDAVKALRRLQSMFQDDNVIVQDVRNDGNCLFAAVVDQLRTQGNAEHDIYSLRVASVEYLRTHPFSEDGTRLDVFLVDETLEEYLMRMCRDGEWGDHMILNSIAEVLHMRVIIYGGIADQQITHITPKSCSFGSIRGDIRIAHLVESHYVSLRAQDWIKKLDSHQDNWRDNQLDDTVEHTIFPLMHFDIMTKIVVLCDYLHSLTPSLARKFTPPYAPSQTATIQLVGDFICEALPTAYSGGFFESMSLSHFFSRDMCRSNEKLMPVLFVPHDSRAKFDNMDAFMKDVFVVGNASESRIKLMPINPSLWPAQTRKIHGIRYLKTFKLTNDVIPENCRPQLLQASDMAGLNAKCILAFNCEWPDCAIEWVTRTRSSDFPNDHIKQHIYMTGCYIVPLLSQPENNELLGDCFTDFDADNDDNTHWCMSFAVSERELFRNMSRIQNCCFLLFRVIVEQAVNGRTLPSSVTKHIFLYACENFPQTDWKIKTGQCLLILLRNIANAFSVGFLAHYFISTRNMLHGLSPSVLLEVASELKKSWTRPVVALQQALETLNIASSDIGPALDLLLADMPDVVALRNTEKSFAKSYYPSYGYAIQIMVLNGEYSNAFTALQDIKTLFENVFARSTDIVSLFQSVLTGIDPCKKWVFALFIDMSLGTKISTDIFSYQSCLHITEVFGPTATELLIDTIIPEGAGIEKGNFKYAEEVADALKQLNKHSASIEVLAYYLAQYATYAGGNFVIPIHDESVLREIMPIVYGGMKPSGGIMPHGSEYVTSTAVAMYLCGIYVRLFDNCLTSGMLDAYRPLFPNYQALAKLGLSSACYQNERVMENYLRMGKYSPESMWSRLMGTDSQDQYMDYEGHDDANKFY